jgi:hypothetical protein
LQPFKSIPIEEAFIAAASDFNASLAVMRPYRNESEGYCEANLIERFSHALTRARLPTVSRTAYYTRSHRRPVCQELYAFARRGEAALP